MRPPARLRLTPVLAAALALAAAGAGPASAAARAPSPAAVRTVAAAPPVSVLPGRPVVLTAGPADPASGPASALRAAVVAGGATRAVAARVTAPISVTYVGFPAAARAAFQAAVTTWSTHLASTVPVHVRAVWQPLGPGVLGEAGPTGFVANFPHAPRPGVYYPVALANALAHQDLNGPQEEVDAQFSSNNPSWYVGTDGRTPAGHYDLETVALHELAHGLGFLGTLDGLDPSGRDTGHGYWGQGPSQPYTFVFDRFVADAAGRPLVTTYANGSTALGTVLRTGLRWAGPRGTAAGRRMPVLYAPRRWQAGSSASHLDEATYPARSGNELLTPILGSGQSDHLPGAVALGMLADIGWTVTASS